MKLSEVDYVCIGLLQSGVPEAIVAIVARVKRSIEHRIGRVDDTGNHMERFFGSLVQRNRELPLGGEWLPEEVIVLRVELLEEREPPKRPWRVGGNPAEWLVL